MDVQKSDIFDLSKNPSINLKLHQSKIKTCNVKLTISKLKLEFNIPIIVKSSKILYLPWIYVIDCKVNDNAVELNEKDSFVLSFFYSSNSVNCCFDIGRLTFSINYNCAQEAEFSCAKDVCNMIDQHLIATKTETEKPYLLIVNPRSGTQRGIKIFQSCVSVVLKLCNVKYDLLVTETALHARNFLKSCESLDKYRGIVTISGDGLVYEVFCGIMDRESWKKDIESTLVSVIPSGSGNGLAASLSAFSGINPMGNIILYNTLLLSKPITQFLDLMRVQTLAGNKFPSFLSLTWGLMAHVDVGSDKFRWMGHARFTVVAAVQLAKMIKYKGKLWYLPAYHTKTKVQTTEEKDGNISFTKSSFKYLPDISEPMPSDDNWVLLDESFVSVIVTLLPYIATDCKMAPNAKLNDGKIHVIVIHSEIPRSELLSSITKLEIGGHFNSKHISYIECLAFRLVPECEKCYMAVDGEWLENTAIQAEIMPSAARTISGPDACGETFFK